MSDQLSAATTSEQAGRSSSIWRAVAILFGIVLVGGSGWYVYQAAETKPASVVNTSGYLSQAELAERYGLKISHIGVGAGGGLVDFRYEVVDPAKAAVLLRDAAIVPTLTAVDTGQTLSPTQMGRGRAGPARQVPYTFFPNIRNAIKPGTPVSVAFGSVHIEPIVAK